MKSQYQSLVRRLQRLELRPKEDKIIDVRWGDWEFDTSFNKKRGLPTLTKEQFVERSKDPKVIRWVGKLGEKKAPRRKL